MMTFSNQIDFGCCCFMVIMFDRTPCVVVPFYASYACEYGNDPYSRNYHDIIYIYSYSRIMLSKIGYKLEVINP